MLHYLCSGVDCGPIQDCTDVIQWGRAADWRVWKWVRSTQCHGLQAFLKGQYEDVHMNTSALAWMSKMNMRLPFRPLNPSDVHVEAARLLHSHFRCDGCRGSWNAQKVPERTGHAQFNSQSWASVGTWETALWDQYLGAWMTKLFSRLRVIYLTVDDSCHCKCPRSFHLASICHFPALTLLIWKIWRC